MALACGTDLVEIARIAELLDAHGHRFVARCFTVAERAYADAGGAQRAARYAARFAAKEAAMKVLGTGWADGVGFADVEVVREPSGRPRLVLHGGAAARADGLGLVEWAVSLTHSRTHASATVVALGSG